MRKRSKWNRIWSQESKNVYINSMPNICCLFIQTDRVARTAHSTINQTTVCLSFSFFVYSPNHTFAFAFAFVFVSYCFFLLLPASFSTLNPKWNYFIVHIAVCACLSYVLSDSKKNERLRTKMKHWIFNILLDISRCSQDFSLEIQFPSTSTLINSSTRKDVFVWLCERKHSNREID